MLPFFDIERVQSRIERGSRRWLGSINSRGKNLEREWSQFLLPPHKSVFPVNAQGEVWNGAGIASGVRRLPGRCGATSLWGWGRIQGRIF